MDSFNVRALIELENFYKPENIYRLRDSFIRENIHEENFPNDIDKEKGILTFYDSHDSRFYESKFEDKVLDPLLWELTTKLKEEVVQSDLLLTMKGRNSYFSRILNKFDTLSENYESCFALFPILNNPKREIESYLSMNFNYSKVANDFGQSYFEIKPDISIRDLKNIYSFLFEGHRLRDNGYINDLEVSEEIFLSVLSDAEPNDFIKFNCSTEIASVILRELQALFNKLNFTTVGKSQKFMSKNDKFLTENNLSKSYSKIKNKNSSYDKMRIEKFFREDLFNQNL